MDDEIDLPGDDEESRRARRYTRYAVWAFAIVELAAMIAAFALKSR